MEISENSTLKQILHVFDPINAERQHQYIRKLKSIRDIFIYRFYTLAPKFWQWAAARVLLLVLSIKFHRSIIHTPWIAVPVSLVSSVIVAFAFFTLRLMIKRWSSDHVGPIKEHDDDLLLGSLNSVLPSEVPDLPSLQKAVTQMIEGGGRYKDSVPLYGALLCLKHAIDHHPDLICDVADYA